MFFAVDGQDFVPCPEDSAKLQGPPTMDDFENDLFESILALRSDGIVENIQASGDAVEVVMGATPAPILSATTAPSPGMISTRSQFQARIGAVPSESGQEPSAFPTWIESEYPTYIDEYNP
jgi:hypothetical protein